MQVWIPDGQVILLDVFTPVLSVLAIEGALYFDPNRPVSLDAYYVFVNGGLMQVGTAEKPYTGHATITLHGDRYNTIEIPNIGAKCLAVANKDMPEPDDGPGKHIPARYVGQLEIHGKKRLRTWTFLAETAVAGSNFFVTLEKVDFAPGEMLILTGSELPRGDSDIGSFGAEELVVQ